ncbi:related to zinc finger protein [Armillaria ostoyae]|uniref:Related to zinc finger protein n=1 Tax=Armillaria ostoyae TaxID=47428 RepID=A0A284S3T4_ARMOS|nr:related to zinc finger protein [Armillaria ostoyae]
MAYCDRCERYFNNMTALRQHELNSSSHNICDDCEIDFSTWPGLKEHYVQSPNHSYCQECDRHFSHDWNLTEHYEDEHDYCTQCSKMFKNEHGLHEHRRQSPHHHYCASCKRDFQSQSNLNSHLNSSIHMPKAFKCPGARCNEAFVSRSAVVLHLENGGCISGADRTAVNRYVRQYDRQNIITDPSRMLTGPGGVPRDEVVYSANSNAWSGSAYECYLCHQTTQTLRSLNQHLASPKHQAKMYICPLESCRIRFTTLSALLQHIESERCGVSRFQVVQNTLNDLMRMRMLTY